MILNRFSFFFTIIVALLYVVNDIIYMFGAKYISFKRIIIEVLMIGIHCIILNYQSIHNAINNSYIWLIIISILDMFYYVIILYFHDENKEEKNKHIISKKIFQVSGVIIIIIEIYELMFTSFDYYHCIHALVCLLTSVYWLFEPFVSVDEDTNHSYFDCVE